MPRKGMASEMEYHLEADTKQEIMDCINKYVIPLYEVALKKLKETGELYYWEQKTKEVKNGKI